jgi:peptidoglycan/xylan/chitin deacetylase (PgdA/CDA1 family)
VTAITSEVVTDQVLQRIDHAARPHQRSLIKSAARKCVLKCSGAIDRLSADTGVLLTFDDGPDPAVTPAVLDLLATFGAKAVFFVVGNRIPRAPQMLSRITAEGHLIGNHTYLHPLDRTPAFIDYYRDVIECQAAIAALITKPPTLFRPPLGSLSIGSLLASRLARLTTVLWSLDVDDWRLRRDEDATRAGERLAALAAPGDIVLLHDDNRCVVPLLEAALPRLQPRLKLGDASARLESFVA